MSMMITWDIGGEVEVEEEEVEEELELVET